MSLTQYALLGFITFFAAMTQSITGFGFALLTLPFFLLILDLQSAIQLTLIATFIITITLIPFVYRYTPKQVVKQLILGSIAGFPIGLFFLNYATVTAIQLFVGIVILLALLMPYWSKQHAASDQNHPINKPLQTGFHGFISGMMATAIAMPGPALAFYAQRNKMSKNETRAMIFMVFMFSYAIAILLQLWMNGLYAPTRVSLMYVLPPAIIGTYVGHKVSRFIPDQLFRKLINIILLLTAVYLLVSNIIKLIA